MNSYVRSILGLLSIATCMLGQTRPLVTARDCVQTRYLLNENGEPNLKINGQGTRIAYLVKAPNLESNDNEIELYVRSLSGDVHQTTRLITVSPKLSNLKWLADGRHIAVMAPANGRIGIVLLDSVTGGKEVLVSAPKDIDEYAINDKGDTVVYALREDVAKAYAHTSIERAAGYRVSSNTIPSSGMVWRSPWIPYKLWLRRRMVGGGWTKPSVLNLRSPFTRLPLATVRASSRFAFSFSPDGHKLLINLADIDMTKPQEIDGSRLPSAWAQSPTYRRRAAAGGQIWITVLHNLETGETSMPFPTPGAAGTPRWSPDGQAFYIVANAPVGSALEAREEESHPSPSKPWHVWRVELGSGRADIVHSDVRDPFHTILWVKAQSIGLLTASHRIATMVSTPSGWSIQSEYDIAAQYSNFGDLASDGFQTVLDYQSSETPPELRFYRNGDKTAFTTLPLNPRFKNLQFAVSREFSWATSRGTSLKGSLLLPPDYNPAIRYPLVIQTKSQQSAFVCDSGSEHYPSFAPQPMATQGLLYLSINAGDLSSHYPPGYPGGIGEAIFYTDVWDSAVRELDHLGIIDVTRVGIIGYSRTGWHTQFALAHASTHYAAATSTDNIQYSLGEYWLLHSAIATGPYDAMYGGPPYGYSLGDWMKYSISFNMDKIHTPLLIEAMGYGVLDDTIGESPVNLSLRYEIVTALDRLKKPVELYYYPNEQHQPDHPKARLASIQRNIDWYRFWLQAYERPEPEDPDQYNRWRRLRSLRDADLRMTSAH